MIGAEHSHLALWVAIVALGVLLVLAVLSICALIQQVHERLNIQGQAVRTMLDNVEAVVGVLERMKRGHALAPPKDSILLTCGHYSTDGDRYRCDGDGPACQHATPRMDHHR